MCVVAVFVRVSVCEADVHMLAAYTPQMLCIDRGLSR